MCGSDDGSTSHATLRPTSVTLPWNHPYCATVDAQSRSSDLPPPTSTPSEAISKADIALSRLD